jgi:hypothetical protein
VAVNLDDMLVRIHPGDGLVARFDGVALVLFAPGAAQARVTDELLQLVEASSNGSAAPGRRLARQVARLLGDADPDEVPSFGLLAQAEHGVVMILHGDADADVTTPTGHEHLSGRQVATWVDRILEPPIEQLVVSPSGQDLQAPDPRLRIRGGVVPGGGLSVGPTDAPAAAAAPPPVAQAAAAAAPAPVPVVEAAPAPVPAPPMPAPEPAMPPQEEPSDATKVDTHPAPPVVAPPPEPAPLGAFVSVILSEVEPDEVREALPVAGQAATGAAEVEAEPEGPLVKGIVCSRGHFTDPAAPFCGICGISQNQKTLQLVEGPRPPLGVLLVDGATFSVDTDYVLGREPESDPEVVAGHARPLTVSDPERTVSRVHAALVLQDWNVRVVDRGSANGTYLAAPGRDDWSPVLANQPTTIKPGTRIRLGQRVVVYDSHSGTR